MTIYQTFMKRLLINYVIGSSVAVFVVGGIFIFTTLSLSMSEMYLMAGTILVSVLIMFICEFLVFRKDLRIIKLSLVKKDLENAHLKLAHEQLKKFPFLTVRRIMLPHLLGFAIPAGSLSFSFIQMGYLDVPYSFISFAYIGSILIAAMHALIEYFLTLRAIQPVLFYLKELASDHNLTLSLNEEVQISIQKKLLASFLVIGLFPILLFTLAAQIRLVQISEVLANQYWQWASIIILLSIIFSVIGARLISQSIQQPISTIYDGMQKVQNGDLTIREHDSYTDDFSRLIKGFNHMVDSLETKDHTNQRLLDSFIQTLATALDARDPYTAGHSIRVSESSVEIGRKLGLSPAVLSQLKKTALLHDIGKIGIADEILLKDGKLTDEEFKRIQEHPVLGENILKQVQPSESMSPLLPGVRHHHERYDGKGYPDQLSGDDIPLFGRIIAVADAFDAMTSNRPYRKGMTKHKAMSIIEDGAGSQWDAQCANIFLELKNKA
ncbi:hypothetical protein CEY16_01095 [Halalkalibacillus sediminis]|uniref:Phosphohydrolase n=1 Tax=Halalkalibacillus sediminis TaxID=2018042 RepID=A0A2I0QVL1_9BACI|nr:HD-GYP domain-containing protein [Halalkalibacillus sediminis]PKR78383.1 hypothetical protein CEY16_01095 [Halalkalibacillus sediminis]